MESISLFDSQGNRKYLTPEERELFEQAAMQEDGKTRTFCLMLLYTGCRISEVLNLVYRNIDYAAKAVTVETLKQRKKGIFRQIPLSENYLDELNLTFDFKKRKNYKSVKDTRIWSWTRQAGHKKIVAVMRRAGIDGIQATPKGLRHGFAIACLDKQIPLNMVQKWLGHTSPTTTAIYANALGQEERNIARRLWEK